MRCVGIATLACSQGGRDRAWCLISGLLQVTLVCTFPIQHRKGSTLSHWSSRGSCYPCTPGAGGQLLASTLRSPRDGWAAVHTLLLQWGWSLVPVWSLEWAAAPHALQEWGGQWNFWCGDWEVILSIQVKTLSNSWIILSGLQEGELCQEISKQQQYDPMLANFTFLGLSPHNLIESSRTYGLSGGGFLKTHCRLKSEVTHLDCSGHLIIDFSQEVAMIVEKAMATHSSTLAWRISGTVEPGGLPSMGLHRVGHDWSDSAAAAMIELSLLASVQLEHSYSCCHCIQLSYVHCWCYMWRVKLLFEMSSSRTNMILSQNGKLYSERCRNTALSYKLDIVKVNIHHRKPNHNFIFPCFKAVSESFIGHKKGT